MPFNPASSGAEIRQFHKRIPSLEAACQRIKILMDDDVDELKKAICESGLYNDNRKIYGCYEYAKAPPYLPATWQHPEEFAKLMIKCRELDIKSVIEIGTFYGYTSTLLATYCFTHIPNFKRYITRDLYRWIPKHIIKNPVFDVITYQPEKTSDDVDGYYDLAIIDGDHSEAGVRKDYANLKDHARYIMFHDINDIECHGVRNLWEELKQTRESIEIIRSDGNKNKYMGIGITCTENLDKNCP